MHVPVDWGREGSTQLAQGLSDRCDSSTACRLCRLDYHTQTSGYAISATDKYK